MEQGGELADWLARQARALGLDALNVDGAPEQRLRDYCRAVLGELAARGLLAGPEEIGCHAAPRNPLN